MSLCQTPKDAKGLETLLDALETDNSNSNKFENHKIDIINRDLSKYTFTDR